MAFTASQVSLMASTGAATTQNNLWFYTNSAADTVTGTGFFNPVSHLLRVGDLIFLGNTGLYHRVATNSGGVVAISAAL